jgi:hypothetical protein
LKPEYVFYLLVASIPFTATSLINYSDKIWMSPFQFFSIFWLMSQLKVMDFAEFRKQFSKNMALIALIIFVFIALLSLMMPVIYQGEILIPPDRPSLPEMREYRLGLRHMLYSLYLIYGAVLFYFISAEVARRDIVIILKVFVVSVTLTAIWGLFEPALYYMGYEYPYYVFNNSSNIDAHGYKQVLNLGEYYQVKRISSVQLEPSIHGQVLLVALAMVITALITNRPIFNKKLYNYFHLVVLSVCAVLTTSSVTLVVLVLILLCATVYQAFTFKKYWGLMAAAVLTFVLVYQYFVSDFIHIYLNEMVLHKISFLLGDDLPSEGINLGDVDGKVMSSGDERVATVMYSKDIIANYPLLGAGWGTVTVHDTVIRIFANSGMFAVMAYMVFLLALIKPVDYIKQVFSRGGYLGNEINMIVKSSLLVMILMQFMTGFLFYLPITWGIFAFADAVNARYGNHG